MYTTKEEENNTMTKRQQEKLNALLTEIAKELAKIKNDIERVVAERIRRYNSVHINMRWSNVKINR